MAMRYRGELLVNFKPSAFSAQHPKGRRFSKSDTDILPTLNYSPESFRHSKLDNKAALTAAKGLMLHAMRLRLPQLSLESTSSKAFLAGISMSWGTVCALQNEIRMLVFCGVTRCKTAGSKGLEPSLLKVRCTLLGRHPSSTIDNDEKNMKAVESETKSQSRIDIDFTVKPRHLGNSDSNPTMEIDLDVDVSVSKVYGFADAANNASRASETKMRDILNKTVQPKGNNSGRIQTPFGNGLWRDTVKDLQRKVLGH